MTRWMPKNILNLTKEQKFIRDLDKDTLLKYADQFELFSLFEEFLIRLEEKNAFKNHRGKVVILDKDKMSTIIHMKAEREGIF